MITDAVYAIGLLPRLLVLPPHLISKTEIIGSISAKEVARN
jgi:hypothetical protein